MRRMLAEWEPHRCTVVAWPTRATVWGCYRQQAEYEYGALINTIAADEPVLVVCQPGDRDRVLGRCSGTNVRLLEHPIDDGWIRDNGPITIEHQQDCDPEVLLLAFGFNSWGERFSPTAGDLTVRAALAAELALPLEDASDELILEGGAISSNGQGTILASRECVLTDSRNPGMSEQQLEEILRARLGAERVIWVPHGLLEDLDHTDGHVDNVAVFVSADTVLAQSCEPSNHNYERLQANAAALRAVTLGDGNPLHVVELKLLPYGRLPDGQRQAVPYLNFTLTNSSVILPSAGNAKLDAEASGFFAHVFGVREVKLTPSLALAYGGGGPHCVTVQFATGAAAGSR